MIQIRKSRVISVMIQRNKAVKPTPIKSSKKITKRGSKESRKKLNTEEVAGKLERNETVTSVSISKIKQYRKMN